MARNVHSRLLTALAACAASALAGSATAQQSTGNAARDSAYMDSVFRAHARELVMRDGRLEGEGARFILEAARRAQFFVIAESHNVAEIPLFTEALFDSLHARGGYRYYAMEYGPVIGRMVSAAGVRGRADSVFALGRRYPHAFHFWNDEEIAAMASIGRRSAARMDPLWGIDQEFGALHVLERLRATAPTPAARALAQRLADSARVLESSRPFEVAQIERFITRLDLRSIASLPSAFQPRPDSEAWLLLDALDLTIRVYADHDAAGRGEPRGHQANLVREQYMKTRFMANYRRAQQRGDTLPRVLVRVGSLHGGKWFSWRTGVHTVGNFLHEFATANGGESFHMVAWLVNEPGTYWSLTEELPYLPLANAGSTSAWTVVDMRPLRDLYWASRMPALSRELREAIFAYDAVLLIGGGTRGTYDRLRGVSASR